MTQHSHSHTYATADKFALSATAKDSGTPALTSKPLSKTIEVTPELPRYSKVCNSGALEGEEDCPVNPELGTNPTDWACTKDNDTGLIWEVKTTDGGLHDMNKTYTNYTTDYDPNKFYEAATNANGFVIDVNSEGLCGASDWRIPTKDELLGIVQKGATNPSIDITHFPNTESVWFWSASVYANNSNLAWIVFFNYGNFSYDYKDVDYAVRLVRAGQ